MSKQHSTIPAFATKKIIIAVKHTYINEIVANVIRFSELAIRKNIMQSNETKTFPNRLISLLRP